MQAGRLDVVVEALPDIAPVLRDHGLKIVGIQNSQYPDTVRLLLEGSGLPAACDGAHPLNAPLVTMVIEQTVYGEQKLVRISSIEVREDAHD